MDSTEGAIKRGQVAESLLEQEAFKEVIDDLLQEQWEAFLATDPLDVKAREKIHSYADAIGGIKRRLENNASEGRRLQREMQDDHKRNETY